MQLQAHSLNSFANENNNHFVLACVYIAPCLKFLPHEVSREFPPNQPITLPLLPPTLVRLYNRTQPTPTQAAARFFLVRALLATHALAALAHHVGVLVEEPYSHQHLRPTNRLSGSTYQEGT